MVKKALVITTVAKAKRNLLQLVRRSIKRHTPIQIYSKDGNAILISEKDYESLLETLELLSRPSLRRSIEEARADIKAGRTKSLKNVFGR